MCIVDPLKLSREPRKWSRKPKWKASCWTWTDGSQQSLLPGVLMSHVLVTGESQMLQTFSNREGLVIVKRVRVAWWVAYDRGPWSSTSSQSIAYKVQRGGG